MNTETTQGLMVGMSCIGLLTTIVWIVVGWRAMRAHERIADALERSQFTPR